MSVWKRCERSARNSSQVHSRGVSTAPSIRSVQSSSRVRGVGPTVSTGKSLTTCWPGGRRSASSGSSGRRRPKPRLISAMTTTSCRRRDAADTTKGSILGGYHRHHRGGGFLRLRRPRLLATEQDKSEGRGDHDRQQPGGDKTGGAGAGDDTELHADLRRGDDERER